MILGTERLVLRPLVRADLDDVASLHGDPEVMAYLTGAGRSRQEVETQDLPELLTRHGWAVIHPRDEGFMGWIALRPDGEAAEFGYRMRRAVWGRGYASEAARAVVDAGFQTLGFERIWGQTMAVNLGSRRVMEKAGLTFVRTFHLDWEDPLPGTEQGEVEYALSRDAWRSAQA